MRRAIAKAVVSLWLILAVALAARGVFAWQQARQVPAKELATVPFAQETGNIAASLASGHGFSSLYRKPTGPTAWLAPVYPLILAGIFREFGAFTLGAFCAAVAFNILCSAGACVPLFFAGKRIGGVGLGAAAGWLWAAFPNAVIVPFEWIWDTSLAALLASGILWATLTVKDDDRGRAWAAYGLLWGLALMTDPSLGSLLPFLLLWLAWRGRRRFGTAWTGIRGPAVAALVTAVCCMPWTIRNYEQFHRWIPLRSDFPFELWIGNNEVLDPNGHDVMARVTAFGQMREYAELGETAFLAKKWREATAFMATHKRLELWLTWRRFLQMWTGSPNPLIDFRDADSNFIRFLLVCNALAGLGAILGIVTLWRQRSDSAFPVTVFPAVYPVVYYIAHASLRYRYPIDPVVMLLGAAAAAWLIHTTASGVCRKEQENR